MRISLVLVDRGVVLHGRRLGEVLADEAAPLREQLGLAEADRVVLQRVPFQDQQVRRRALDPARDADGPEALGSRDDLARLLHRGLEVGLASWGDGHEGPLDDHAYVY